ncbi:MAG TPA: DNRLRE domain-containing protein [Candidatus Limnocylindrales bacterium]
MVRRGLIGALCVSLVAAGSVLLGSGPPARAAVVHPFLLATPDEYAALQARAAQEPWATWRAGAIPQCAATYNADPDNDGNPSMDLRVRQMSIIAGACSLAYILDEPNRATHRAKLLSLITAARTDMYPDMAADPAAWSSMSGGAGAFFHLVVGLDVIHSDLTAAQAADAEAKLDPFAELFYANRSGSWEAARIGGYGIWSAFRCGPAGSGGCAPTDTHARRITESISRLRAHLAEQSSPDGVYLAGPNYAGHRLGSAADRDSKSYYADVLTKTGHHNFYTDASYVKYMEHLNGYAITPVVRHEPWILRPEADATVRGGTYGGTNFGGTDTLIVKDDASIDYDREAFLRFNLTSYEAGHPSVQKALLRLPVEGLGGDGAQVRVSVVADDAWTESGITWNNRPTAATQLVVWTSHSLGATREVDVTALVNQILADPGDSKLSLRIVATVTGSGNWVHYGSREHVNTSIRPALVLRSASDLIERDQYTFGDSGTTRGALYRSARVYSAGRFGPVAAANAAWSLAGVSPGQVSPLITAYVLTVEPPGSAAPVPSKIFKGGGAWFLEQSTRSTALAGALWNASKEAEHQHNETNALHLTAYGEHVLRNSGYNGTDAAGAVGAFSYPIVRGRAVVSNTVLIDYDRHFTDEYAPSTTNDHALKHGAGIIEGFTGPRFDYASGDSGAALPNGKHVRNFAFVHPSDGANGYWLVFDEVDATTGGVPASVAWHPNSAASPQTATALTEYTSTVGPDQRTGNNVKLTTFLGTAPSSVAFKWGPFGDRGESVQGRYLYASYPTDSAGRKNIVTVLFPSDASHPKAPMTRLSGSGYTGASIAHPGGPADYAFESSGASVVSGHGASWQAPATHFRVGAGGLVHYFVRKGRSFTDGAEGFSAPSPVSVYLNGKTGQILNGNTGTVNVTFKYPGLRGVKLNGVPATVVSSGIGSLTVAVPTGTRTVELTTGPFIVVAADAHVRGGDYAATNLGSAEALVVKNETNPSFDRDAYLRFDLSGHTGGPVASAKLKLRVETAEGATHPTQVWFVTDDSWQEAAITWNTKPAGTSLLGGWPAPSPGDIIELDVTAIFNSTLAGDRLLSLRLNTDPGYSGAVGDTYGSRENPDPTARPILELTN